jgi:ribonuclease P protein component
VLPAARRLRHRAEFSDAVRLGQRAGSPGLVAHLLITPRAVPARVGFVVGRGVGPAVVRNRVRRRMRHLVADRLTRLPAGALLVIRATPASADASSADLGVALDRVFDRVLPVPA